MDEATCPRCHQRFKNAVGVRMHLLWNTRCLPRGEQPPVINPENNIDRPVQRITPLPVNNPEDNIERPVLRIIPPPVNDPDNNIQVPVQRRTPTPPGPQPVNNLLLFTAIQDDMSVHSDENYSTISDNLIRGFNIPDFLLGADENEPPRSDGRQRRIIDYVEGLIQANNRISSWTRMKNLMLQIFTFLYELVAFLYCSTHHGLRWCIILMFVVSIILCHGGHCTEYSIHLYGDQDLVNRIKWIRRMILANRN